MLFGGSDGLIYRLDDSVATDDGSDFATLIIGKSIGGDLLHYVLLKAFALDYTNHVAGNGALKVSINRNESSDGMRTVFPFTTIDESTKLAEATMYLYSATDTFETDSAGRIVTYYTAEGETIAPVVHLVSGALTVNNALMRVAFRGRAGK